MSLMCGIHKHLASLLLCWTAGLGCLVGMPIAGLHAQRTPRFDYFFLEASKCMRNHDYASAEELFGHCLEMDSTAAEALYSMSMLDMFLLGRDSTGLDMLERACRKDSCNTQYLNVLGKVYLRHRDTEKVIPVLERLSRLRKNRSDVLEQLVSVYRSEGKNEKALQTLKRIELMEGMSYETSMLAADVYNDMGMPDSARVEMQRLSDTFPHEMGFRLLLASKYVDEGKASEARGILEEVTRKEPQYRGLPAAWLYFYQHTDWPRYLQVRDSMLFAPGTSDDQRCMLLDAYAREATHDSVRMQSLRVVYDTLTARPDCTVGVLLSEASWVASNTKDQAPVAQIMRQVLDKDPANDPALGYLLTYYLERNDEEGIMDVCRRGVSFHPGELVYPYFLSAILVRQGKDAEARTTIEQGLKTREASTGNELVSDTYAMLGDLYHGDGRAEDSFAAYDSSLVYNQDNASCLNNYAYFLSLTGKRLDEAEEMSYRTIVLEPRNAIYLDTYAWILFMKRKYTEARIYMNRAVDPKLEDAKLLENADLNGNILEHAGDIHACCGDMDLAMRFWRLAAGLKDGTCSKRITQKIKKRKYIQ